MHMSPKVVRHELVAIDDAFRTKVATVLSIVSLLLSIAAFVKSFLVS